ncbi:pentatricopeptide repeat-containing protein [Tripterygium wilfordii]|uniref:Pentatricopeptide repeat-containing protein n=1 Tax=Tripterygium wilfordii TaxID=458696 RepID=A0A7J7DXK8_TRIWF|nr:pentatricopeptide repeat-containing protein [Tripterygium wilfordii]
MIGWCLVAGAVLLGSKIAATGSGSSGEEKKTMKATGRDHRMYREDFEKDPKTYFRDLRNWFLEVEGREVGMSPSRSGPRDAVPWSALTAGYARRDELGVARKLFNEMPTKDLVSWNVMITTYAKQGEMGSARELFDNILKRVVVTWNVMIAGYVSCGSCELALEMFEEMGMVGQQPDQVTMLSLLSALCRFGRFGCWKENTFCPFGDCFLEILAFCLIMHL